MREQCHDIVGVLAAFGSDGRGGVRVVPQAMNWRGRKWRVETMGLYHPERRGNKRVHIFAFAAGETAFRVELDPDSLEWTLTEVFYS